MTGFLQTSDIHIGECRSLDGYLERHRSLLEQIIYNAHHYRLPVIIPGDLFHVKGTSHRERYLAAWFIQELDRTPLGAIISSGNHDHIDGEFTQLHEFALMPLQKVKIVPWEPRIEVLNDINFLVVPWRNYSTEELEKVVVELSRTITNSHPRVVMLHECLIGSRFDNGVLAPKGCKIPNIPSIAYWAVGDLHMFQGTNVPNGHYAGAPAQFKSDDVPGKGMLLVDLSKPTSPTFLPLKSKEIRVVKTFAEVKDDAYYIVEGDYDEVLKANRDTNVIRTVWKPQVGEAIAYQKLGIYDGLPEFLATKGLPTEKQEFAVNWVKKILKLEGAA